MPNTNEPSRNEQIAQTLRALRSIYYELTNDHTLGSYEFKECPCKDTSILVLVPDVPIYAQFRDFFETLSGVAESSYDRIYAESLSRHFAKLVTYGNFNDNADVKKTFCEVLRMPVAIVEKSDYYGQQLRDRPRTAYAQRPFRIDDLPLLRAAALEAIIVLLAKLKSEIVWPVLEQMLNTRGILKSKDSDIVELYAYVLNANHAVSEIEGYSREYGIARYFHANVGEDGAFAAFDRILAENANEISAKMWRAITVELPDFDKNLRYRFADTLKKMGLGYILDGDPLLDAYRRDCDEVSVNLCNGISLARNMCMAIIMAIHRYVLANWNDLTYVNAISEVLGVPVET